MCLILFAFRPGQALPLLVAANRDEFYARQTLALAPWQDAPQIYGGRDLKAGGSWLGVTADGRFAALTNIRERPAREGARSRGELVADFLRGADSPAAYLERTARRLGDYAGFNLLAGDSAQLYFLNAKEGVPRPLAAGVYGLSNATLDTPWPKLVRSRAAFARALELGEEDIQKALFALLADREQAEDSELPDTGLQAAFERLLSSPFIASADYGTRASTVLLRRADGSQHVHERRFGAHGHYLGEQLLTLAAPAPIPLS